MLCLNVMSNMSLVCIKCKVLAILRTHPHPQHPQQINIFNSFIVNQLQRHANPDQGTYKEILRAGFEAHALRAEPGNIKVKNRGKRVEHGDLWHFDQGPTVLGPTVPADRLKYENKSAEEVLYYEKTTLVSQ